MQKTSWKGNNEELLKTRKYKVQLREVSSTILPFLFFHFSPSQIFNNVCSLYSIINNMGSLYLKMYTVIYI